MTKRAMNSLFTSIAAIALSTVILTGCGAGEKMDETVSEIEQSAVLTDVPEEQTEDPAAAIGQENVYTYDVDITHDGESDKIIVDLRNILADDQLPAKVSVQDSNEELLYEEELFLTHAGWNRIYLCRHEGEVYLLSYQPNHSQGFGSYTYNLYYIEGQDQPESAATGAVQFDEYMNADNAEDFFYPEAEMVQFAQDLNAYLSESILLISTYDGQVTYSTPEEEIRTSENYAELLTGIAGMDAKAVENNGIQENITLFRQYMEDEYARMAAELGTDQTGGYDYELMAQQCAEVCQLPDTLGTYSIGDVNQDGIPEFIICRGTCESDYMFHIYSFDGEQLTEIGEITGGDVYRLYTYSDREGIVVWVQQAGYEKFIELIPSTGVVTTIYEGEMATDEEQNTYTCYEQPSDYMDLFRWSYEDMTAEGIYAAICEQLE